VGRDVGSWLIREHLTLIAQVKRAVRESRRLRGSKQYRVERDT
jgi:hypothetical protein